MSTLLLADDSATIRRVIELSFADEGVDVVAVGTAQEALASLEAAAPDLILVDVGLPDLDGYELARRVKASPDRQAIPLLLLAGAFGPVDEDQVRECGAAGVFVKPFEPQALVTRVKELIAEAPPRRPSPPSPVVVDKAAAEPARPDPPASDAVEAVGARPAAPEAAAAAPAAPVPRTSLASIFATVLAAEQAAPAGQALAPVEVEPDVDVEAIVRQVLARITDERLHQVVRDAAERLVREALERAGTE